MTGTSYRRAVRSARRSRAVARLSVGLAFLVGLLAVRTAEAQNGALYLLMPFGGKSAALGDAVSADTTLGTEAMWWNPAALARLPKKEIAVHHGQSIIVENSDMVAYAVPSRVLGTVAVSALVVNYGDQEATDPFGNPSGTITNRNYQLAVSYATSVGPRFSAGLTYKVVMLRFQSVGACGDCPSISGNTSALDLGAQYRLGTTLPVSIGASIRNLGPALQVRDAAQADPLPRVIQVGAQAQVPWAALNAADATLEVSADVQSAAAFGGAAGGIGATLGYRKQLFLRAGYKFQPDQGGGPSFGVGFERGALGVDFGRRFDGFSGQASTPPTFVSLRARF